MFVFKGIFYTNFKLTPNLAQFIAKIKQMTHINKYTVFIIYFNKRYKHYEYIKYWKSRDCKVLNIRGKRQNEVSFSKGMRIYRCSGAIDDEFGLYDGCTITIDEFKKMCDDYDLLEKHVEFKYKNDWYTLNSSTINYFHLKFNRELSIMFEDKHLSVNDFIQEIMTNYPECYKCNYSQIKPAIH